MEMVGWLTRSRKNLPRRHGSTEKNRKVNQQQDQIKSKTSPQRTRRNNEDTKERSQVSRFAFIRVHLFRRAVDSRLSLCCCCSDLGDHRITRDHGDLLSVSVVNN